MDLSYPGKTPASEVRAAPAPGRFSPPPKDDRANWLIEGDNLGVLRLLLHVHGLADRVDLVYIDPPYATNTVFRSSDARTAHVSHKSDAEVAYADTLRGPEYLEFLRQRLILLHALLSPRGAIFVHIDCKIGHYVKIIMDEVFGQGNFRNDITRIKCNPKNFARKGFGNIKDMILFYTKGDDFVWHEPRDHLTESDVVRLFPRIDAQGRRYTTTPLHAPGETTNGPTGKPWRGMNPPEGRHWRYPPNTLDELDQKGLIEWSSTGNPRKIIHADEKEVEGKKLQDIWEFKDHPYPKYPTEKNMDLLRTIIAAASDPGGTVLDCFCGSGTTLAAAHELNRRWIGIDNSPIALRAAAARIQAASTGGGLFQNDRAFEHLTLSEVPNAKAQAPRNSPAARVGVRRTPRPK